MFLNADGIRCRAGDWCCRAAITPAGIGTQGAAVLVVFGLAESLPAPAYSGIADYGEKVGELLR